MISWKEVVSPKNDFAWQGRDTSRPRQMTDIQYNTTIMGGPTRFGFSPKASGFYPSGDATALAGEGDVRGVVRLIQASA